MIQHRKAAKVGDIVMSSLFATGWHRDEMGVWVGESYGKPDPALMDASRSTAKYVVTDSRDYPASEGSSGGCLITATRLADDGTFDPNGEKIAFYMESDLHMPWIDSEIEVIGRMRPILTFEKID